MNPSDSGRPETPRQTIRSIAPLPSALGLVGVRRDHDGPEDTNLPPARERLVLSVDEAAYLLNISRTLAYELVARGELPALRLGRRIVIPRAALEELLEPAIRGHC